MGGLGLGLLGTIMNTLYMQILCLHFIQHSEDYILLMPLVFCCARGILNINKVPMWMFLLEMELDWIFMYRTYSENHCSYLKVAASCWAFTATGWQFVVWTCMLPRVFGLGMSIFCKSYIWSFGSYFRMNIRSFGSFHLPRYFPNAWATFSFLKLDNILINKKVTLWYSYIPTVFGGWNWESSWVLLNLHNIAGMFFWWRTERKHSVYHLLCD